MTVSDDRRDDAAKVTPVQETQVVTLRFRDDGTVPNNPDLPVLVMRGALGGGASPRAVTARFAANGWGGAWVWQVFDYHHYHPDAHEVLAVVSGEAVLMLGGPGGREVTVTAGDVVVLPAGTGHRQVEANGDFRVCGAYPPGQETFDTIRAERPHGDDVVERIAGVSLPEADPIYGADGPLVGAWAEG